MFDEHVIHEPAFVKSLVEDVVIGAVAPLGFIGHLGYRWWAPDTDDNAFNGYQVAVFPTAAEIRGAHAADGGYMVAGFHLDVNKIIQAMSSVDEVVWRTPAHYNGNLDGPGLDVRGHFAGQRVWLRIFHQPPHDEPIAYCVDPSTGRTWERLDG